MKMRKWKFYSENLKERKHLGDTGTDRSNSGWILCKPDVR
jgi:hypothetical protein